MININALLELKSDTFYSYLWVNSILDYYFPEGFHKKFKIYSFIFNTSVVLQHPTSQFRIFAINIFQIFFIVYRMHKQKKMKEDEKNK